MRRRICVLGIALGVGPLAFLGGAAGAIAKSSVSSKSRAKGTPVSCKAATSIAVAAGSSQVLAPVTSGDEYGMVRCGGMLGAGVQHDSFNVPVSGDTLAGYTLYFSAGTLHGTYDLTPQQTGLDFYATSWVGTMKVTGGTGAYRGFKGTGKMVCQSNDGIHTTCTDRLSLRP